MTARRCGRRRRPRFAILAIGATLALTATACSSSDDAGSDGSPNASVDSETGLATDASASGKGTVTMDDGSIYFFDMTTCLTSGTAPDVLPLANGFNLLGISGDGFRLEFIRAGASDEESFVSGTFNGKVDSGGAAVDVEYHAVESTVSGFVTGPNVAATVTFKSLDVGAVHGPEPVATIDVTC